MGSKEQGINDHSDTNTQPFSSREKGIRKDEIIREHRERAPGSTEGAQLSATTDSEVF